MLHLWNGLALVRK